MAITVEEHTEENLKELSNKLLVELLEEEYGITKFRAKDRKALLIDAVIDQVKEKEGVNLSAFSVFQVRYVGANHQQILHNANSTITGAEYEFPRGLWVTVDERDYAKYDTKIQKSITANSLPQWEVRRVNPVSTKVKEFYQKAMNKLRLIHKPRSLMDMKTLNENLVIKLEGFNVRTIKELASMSEPWLSQTLGIDTTTVLDIVTEAKEALK